MTHKFTGLSAFALTPLSDDRVDEQSFAGLIDRLREAEVDSIAALGSTGSYAYLNGGERDRVARIAVEHAGEIPVIIGVGAMRTSEVLARIDAAAAAGAAGLLLAPVSYQPLTENEVFELYRAATERSDVPVIVYDNPGTTHFTFTDTLIARIAALDGIASVKIPGVPESPAAARDRVRVLRELLPAHVSIGVSGDAHAARGLTAGCDAWYSVIGGTLPAPALEITRAAQAGRHADAEAASSRLGELWQLFTDSGGSIRVVAAIAELLKLAPAACLPQPLMGLDAAGRERVAAVIATLGLT